MKLELKGIIDRGVPNKERVLLAVLLPGDLSFYTLLHTVAADAYTVRPGAHPAYWFPGKTVSLGDQIIVYSGPGSDNSVRRPDGGTNHFFYWGLNQTIWQDPTSRVVLFEHQTWETR